jgi:hypothetical protein
MTDEVPIPTPPLSPEELDAFTKLSPTEVEAIDQAILSFCAPLWRKVAAVVGRTLDKLREKYPQFSDALYSERIRVLVDKGYLESQGNLSHMRFSEVKLPEEN